MLNNSGVKNYYNILILAGLIILNIINKYFILKDFGFKYTGNDDLIFWQSAADYARGIFHEPYFYGQNYNFMIESVLAVPLILPGIPFNISLPLSTTLIGAFPFLFFSIILFKNGHTISSYLFLLILLTLPVEYDLLTAMSRGFVNGIFFCSFLIFCLLKPQAKSSFVLLGFAVSFGYIVNPNSLIFSFPVCLYLLFINYKRASFYMLTIVCALPALAIHYFSQQFYVKNPEYIAHWMWTLDFSFERLADGFSHLDKFFSYLTPVFWKGNWIVLLVILIIGAVLFNRDRKRGLSIILSVLFILILMGINKINDDMGIIYLSSIRMFLAVPLLLGLSVFWSNKFFVNMDKWKLIIICVALSVFFVKISVYRSIINIHTQKTNFGPVAIKKTDELKSDCSELYLIASKNNVDLIVYIPNGNLNVPAMAFFNYGCPILEKNMPATIMNVYEKRSWVFEREKRISRESVLIINHIPGNPEEIKNKINFEIIENNPVIILIKDNNKTLQELSEIFNFDLKRHTY
jgi:hypothetical protein